MHSLSVVSTHLFYLFVEDFRREMVQVETRGHWYRRGVGPFGKTKSYSIITQLDRYNIPTEVVFFCTNYCRVSRLLHGLAYRAASPQITLQNTSV